MAQTNNVVIIPVVHCEGVKHSSTYLKVKVGLDSIFKKLSHEEFFNQLCDSIEENEKRSHELNKVVKQ